MCKNCCVEVKSLFGSWCISVGWVKDFGIFEFGDGELDCYCYWFRVEGVVWEL